MKTKTFLFIFMVFFILSLHFSWAEEPENYCKHKESWSEWDALVAKYPDDMDTQMLHALRIGLCLKVEQGSIAFDMATDLFNRAHDMVINKRKAEQNSKLKDS